MTTKNSHGIVVDVVSSLQTLEDSGDVGSWRFDTGAGRGDGVDHGPGKAADFPISLCHQRGRLRPFI